VAAPDREYSESDVRGNHRKPPHLPVVGAGNSFDPGPARRRQEAKRGAQWRLESPIGEEIVHSSRHAGWFSKTPPGLTGKTSVQG
jgi:hypothetical protein